MTGVLPVRRPKHGRNMEETHGERNMEETHGERNMEETHGERHVIIDAEAGVMGLQSKKRQGLLAVTRG